MTFKFLVRAGMMGMLVIALLATVAVAEVPPRQGGGQDESVRTEEVGYAVAKKAYDDAIEAWEVELAAAPDDKKAQVETARPQAADFVSRFWAIHESQPGTEDSYESLAWIHRQVDDPAHWQKARAAILRSYGDRDDLTAFQSGLFMRNDDVGIEILKNYYFNSPHKSVRGFAGYLYGFWLRQNDFSNQLELTIDIFESLVGEFADVERPPGGTMGEAEEVLGTIAEIKNLRRFGIGKTLPELSGKDFDGVPMKLSDYRGRVVMLSYWAYWCQSCVQLLPHERSLVREYEQAPFTLIGINGDPDLEEARNRNIQDEITWRSFWDGGREGNILKSDEWAIPNWPTVLLLDHQGKIRFRWVGTKPDPDALDEAIAALVTKAVAR